MQNNPYIGPRPFERADRDKFFGRMRETRDLLSLIMAERVVLFYAQSGAGKTSLLNTQIIPALEEEGFQVLPVVRVGGDLPPGLPPRMVKNVFTFSVWMALTGKESPTETSLVSSSSLPILLKQYLARESVSDEEEQPRPPILIIDQFEEILTTHRAQWQDARGFFEQLAETLNKIPKLGVVLAMREDHVAGLDPYAPLLPRRLKARYRMEQLKVEGALEAVHRPAHNAGHPFAPDVAEKLVDDLRRVRMVRSDAAQAASSVLGPYVEPVQLQVVCNRLWENLPEREASRPIEWDDVEKFGNIDRALTDFYESALYQALEQSTAANIVVRERQLRQWFGAQLITPEQTRGLAMRGAQDTDGIPNPVVDMLESRHIIRADLRAGARWYEISHDRLVEPILRSNADWEQTAQSPLHRAAQRWRDADRNSDLLYRGKVLQDAVQWVEANRDACEPLDLEFLEASQKARAAALRELRQNTLIRRLAVAALIALIVATVASVFAFRERDRAETQRQVAEDQKLQADIARGKATVRQLISQASELSSRYPKRSLLLGLEALRVSETITNTTQTGALSLDAEDTLRRVLATTGGLVLGSPGKSIGVVAFSPDHHWLLSRNSTGQVQLWQVQNSAPLGKAIQLIDSGPGTARSVAFSLTSRQVAAIDRQQHVQLWNLTADGSSPAMALPGDAAITALVFSPNNKWLIGISDQKIVVWDMSASTLATAAPQQLDFGDGTAAIPAISPDSHYLAVAGRVSATPIIRVWKLDDLAAGPVTLYGHTDAITDLAFKPDSRWLASASADATARLWNMEAQDPSAEAIVLTGHEEQLTSLAFTSDGLDLITGSFDTTARVWDLTAEDPAEDPIVLRGHNDQVLDLAISPDDRWLFTASRDGTVRAWDLTAPDLNEPSASYVLRGHEGPVNTVAVSSDSRTLATGSDDGTAQLWGVTTPNLPAEPVVLRGHTSVVRGTPIDKDNHWLATYGGDGAVRLWDLTAPEPAAKPIVLRGHTASIYAGVISPDGHWLATGSQDSTARVWDLKVSDPVRSGIVLTGHVGALRTVNFSPDSRWLITAGRDGVVRVWDMRAKDVAQSSRQLKGHNNQVRVSDFSPDGHWLITGGDDGNPRLWDVSKFESGVVPSIVLPAGGSIRALDFSPDSRWVASGGTDNVVRLWDLTAPNIVSSSIELRDHTGAIRVVRFTPDGRWLATASADSNIFLWDMRLITSTGKLALTFRLARHAGEVRALDVSADSHWLMSGSEDGTARLWDLTAADPGAYSIVFPGHGGPVWSVAISPGNKWFATASQDATGRLWQPVSLEVVKQAACQTAGRNLSLQEWTEYGGEQTNYDVTCAQYAPGAGVTDAAATPTPTPTP